MSGVGETGGDYHSKRIMDELVTRLAEGSHPVEMSLRPEKNLQECREAIDRGYVHIKFTDTRGGTELGVELDMEACDLDEADFEAGSGKIHLEGGLTLNYVEVICIADIDLASFSGAGHLKVVAEVSP